MFLEIVNFLGETVEKGIKLGNHWNSLKMKHFKPQHFKTHSTTFPSFIKSVTKFQFNGRLETVLITSWHLITQISFLHSPSETLQVKINNLNLMPTYTAQVQEATTPKSRIHPFVDSSRSATATYDKENLLDAAVECGAIIQADISRHFHRNLSRM